MYMGIYKTWENILFIIMLLLFNTNDLSAFNDNLTFELLLGNSINNDSLVCFHADSLQPQMYKRFPKS